MTLAAAAQATMGELLCGAPDLAIAAVSTDTRTIAAGSLYIALRGERFDGHGFLAEAARQGAVAAVVDARVPLPAQLAAIRVDDTLLAYGRLAGAWRRRLGATVVAVTGSSGKTSTKEAIADLLGRFALTAKSHANFNNQVGVPRTLLELRPGPRFIVLEFGMRGPGEIAYLADVAAPDIGVVTNVGTAHIGRLGSQAAIAAAKAELVEAIPNGRVVLNGDDPYCREMGVGRQGVCYFSLRPSGADVWAADEPRQEGDSWVVTVQWRQGPQVASGQAQVLLPLPGAHHVANALAAIGVAWHLGLELPATLPLAPPAVGGRSRVVAAGDIEILDETYNANPESARASLDAFCKLPCAGRRVAVFGEMAELGAFAEQAHRDLGKAIGQLPLDLLVTVGDLAGLIARAAPTPSQ
ncbi:MAG: UDP-N-acetylmuramoyl-tripeptide--D-alanyl-D-alanine ligase, partial [Cyanobacteria bacterium REEB65]|nr:UDP-N-acetylmuramoyl-tripeptide--D-alanyl-D-alanine ligase [Cyanobacteria bacterium REEB65]